MLHVKRFSLFVLALIIAFAALGCSDDGNDQTNNPPNTSTVQDSSDASGTQEDSSEAQEDSSEAQEDSSEQNTEDSEDYSDSSGGGEEALNAFVTSYATVVCQQMFNCCTSDELQNLNFPSDVDQCTQDYLGEMEAFIQAGESGQFELDKALAQSCLEKLEATSCENFQGSFEEGKNLPEECMQALIPKTPLDEPCALDLVCMGDDAYCTGTLEDPENKVCKHKPGQGEACPDFSCQDGLFCAWDGQTGYCQLQVAIDGTCTSEEACVDGAYCQGVDPWADPPVAGVCTARKEAGEACDSFEECLSYSCENNVCVADPIICDGI